MRPGTYKQANPKPTNTPREGLLLDFLQTPTVAFLLVPSASQGPGQEDCVEIDCSSSHRHTIRKAAAADCGELRVVL